MGNLLERIASTPLVAKIGVILGLIALLGAGYWYFFYSDLLDEKEQLEHEAVEHHLVEAERRAVRARDAAHR